MPEMPLKQLIMLLHYGVLVFSTLKTCRDIYVSNKLLSNRVGITQGDSQFLAVAVMLPMWQWEQDLNLYWLLSALKCIGR